MNIEVRNSKIVSVDGLYIDCEINHPNYGWIPFTAFKNDVEELSRDVWKLISDSGSAEPFIPLTIDELAIVERGWRDLELSWFDTVLYRNQFYWDSLTQDDRDVRLLYRTKLLDYPQQTGFPTDISLRPVRPDITE